MIFRAVILVIFGICLVLSASVHRRQQHPHRRTTTVQDGSSTGKVAEDKLSDYYPYPPPLPPCPPPYPPPYYPFYDSAVDDKSADDKKDKTKRDVDYFYPDYYPCDPGFVVFPPPHMSGKK